MTGITVNEFIKSITEKYKSGQAKEHAYRPALEKLFADITGLNVINDPKRSEHGAPDFVFMKGKIAAAYAEAKDIGVSLDDTEKGEQMERYFGYTNLILTDSLEFRFFRNGLKYETIKIAEIKNNELTADENNFGHLEDTIKQFVTANKEPIKSGFVLAKVMAGKARRIRDNIKSCLDDGDTEKNKSLLAVYDVIKKLLLADLNYEKFADMYAQTLVYGLFVARHNDTTLDTFSRQEARDLVPKSNPFLRKFFDHIAGEDFDERINFIVNELCEDFTHADIRAIVHNYYNVEKDDSRDPIIHFYEDFLQEYDPLERKKMGVFYTPLPVVRFIVRAIDDILKKEFGLNGLADTSRVEIKGVQGAKKNQSVHKVQILDPATGTGTFLNEVIEFIKKSFAGQEGRWANYASEELLPRLHGFELMMASYTIAHLKLSTTFKESGANIDNQRLGVYLTNSLEKAESYENTLFSGIGLGQAITDESVAASKVKNDLPIMVVLGNPPYSISSQNKGEWIISLIEKYKRGLNEQNINALSDDYVKFIRFAEYLIEKNGEGVIGMITNNSFLDGITHRQMRKHLLETFDSIYILDLHGNAKKKEIAPDGGPDQNVFNIMQGVSISLFVKKTKNKNFLGKVYHAELFGKQKDKYDALNNFDFEQMKWKKIDYKKPYYFFVPKDTQGNDEYDHGFSLKDVFIEFSSGVKFRKDSLLVGFTPDDVLQMLSDINLLDTRLLLDKYNFKETVDWKLNEQKNNFKIGDAENIKTLQYRPLDRRYTYYPLAKINKIIPRGDSRKKLMSNFNEANIGLITKRGTSGDWNEVFITKDIMDLNYLSAQTYIFPLYLYIEDGTKVNNLRKGIIKEIEEIVGKTTSENVLDYIYAILHSPIYRTKYKEFLKIDFPRVPYPKDEKQFFALAKLGEELRHLHLMESPKVNNFITTYSEAGDNLVEKVVYENGKVFINKTQFFGNVPQTTWDFFIGGYQPAQKWLKDRKGRKLSNADVELYQKIIVVLMETARVMAEIGKVNPL